MDQTNNENTFTLTEDQINEVRRAAIEKAKTVRHDLRQHGPHLVCISCDYPHTVLYIGVNKRLIGVRPDGSPILKDLSK